jgi:hypothetical protein
MFQYNSDTSNKSTFGGFDDDDTRGERVLAWLSSIDLFGESLYILASV